jgi:hypothetical protein
MPRPAAIALDTPALTRQLLDLGLAGRVANTRDANLRAIRMLLDGVSFYTFGIAAVHEAVSRGMLDEPGVVALMARACGQDSPEAFLSDWGVIAPERTVEALWRAARCFRRVVQAKGTAAFGTGHPGSLLSYYNRLAAYVRAKGGTVAQGKAGVPVGVDWYLDYVGDVAVTSDYCGVLHGHSTRPMEAVIATCGRPIDLVVGDHGHAGAAVNAGIPTIALMDTNDPALEVAAHLEVEHLYVVPFYDNQANAVTARFADTFLAMVEAVSL